MESDTITLTWRDNFCFLPVIGAFRRRCSRWNPKRRRPDPALLVSLLQMRSYNRHTLVADPYEDGFGDFLLKKQKMIELEKKVRRDVITVFSCLCVSFFFYYYFIIFFSHNDKINALICCLFTAQLFDS